MQTNKTEEQLNLFSSYNLDIMITCHSTQTANVGRRNTRTCYRKIIVGIAQTSRGQLQIDAIAIINGIFLQEGV